MKLNLIERGRGGGVPLLLIHGWAMNAAVMAEFADALSAHFRVLSVELPGHGQSPDCDCWGLDEVVASLQSQLDEPVICLGWSLGGLVALQLATTAPELVRRLVLLAATPRFVAESDWPAAQAKAVFDQFARDLDEDARATLLRFLLLQTQGLKDLRQTVQHLQNSLAKGGEATPNGLRCGLQILREADLRGAFQSLTCPVQMILGGRDRLIPNAMAEQAKQLLPRLQVELIATAAHQPFLSHPDETLQAIQRFCETERNAA